MISKLIKIETSYLMRFEAQVIQLRIYKEK